MPTVLLIRHGESQANAGYPTDSYETVELTNKGFAQSEGVAAYLLQASLIPDFIVTSPFLRTQQAAFPLKFFLSQEYLLPAVEEQWPVHEFTYLSSWRDEYSTVYDRQPVVDLFWKIADPAAIDGPGAESFEQFIKRVRYCKANLESSGFDTIAVFSHEQFISAFLWLIGRGEVTPTSEEMREFRSYLQKNPLPNGAIVQAKFRRENAEWTFEKVTAHLSAVEDALVAELESADVAELEPALPRR